MSRGSGGLGAASAGPQPVLGQHAASPHCRGGSNGEAGDRMTAPDASGNAIPTHANAQPDPVGKIPHFRTHSKVDHVAGRHVVPKRGLGYTLESGGQGPTV